jgi:Asp-tRNA(Asn)/Glu-tRNA(Gln) amidotransferase A subunit family amidase
VPPPIAEVDASDEAYFAWNARFLKNVGVLNFLDGCGASLPCQAPGGAPVGLTVFGPAMSDRRTLAAAVAIEKLLRRLD